MTITTPLPSPPQTSDPTNFSTKADAWVAAMAVFQTELDAYAAGLSPLGRNMLINPAFQIDQRNAGASTATADDAYCFDRWYALTQTGTVAASQLTDPENGYTHAMRLTQSQASAQRFGFAQIIEGKNCKFARGGSGTLLPRIRCSASTAIRYAILGWTGTEDAVTSDVVLSWTSGTFTAGNFFNSTTLSVLGVGAVTPSAATWTSLTALTASLGSSFNNIIVMVWTETAQAQNVTLDVDYVQFEAGATANPFERRSYPAELQLCLYYYEKISTTSTFAIGSAESTTGAIASIRFGTPKRSAPTIAVPAAGNGAAQAYFSTGAGAPPSGYGTNSANFSTVNGFRFDGGSYTGLGGAGTSAELIGGASAAITASAEL